MPPNPSAPSRTPLEGAIHRRRVSDDVVASLRDAILGGRFSPGTPLREVALSKELGVSRTTVREALQALAGEGLVQQLMHRGTIVPQPTEQDVVDVYRARLAIESAAAGAVGGRPDLSQLDHALDQMQSAVERDDLRGSGDADLAFHRALVGLLLSPRLDAFYAQLQSELRFLLLVAARQDPEPRQVAQHRALYDLAARGAVDRLRAALGDHIEAAQDDLLRVLEG